MIFKLGELFCGPGGIALGAKQAKVIQNKNNFEIHHVWATDYDRDTCNTYKKNICNDKKDTVVCKDIRKLDEDNFQSLKKFQKLMPLLLASLVMILALSRTKRYKWYLWSSLFLWN